MRTTIFNVVKTTLNGCDFFGSEFFFVIEFQQGLKGWIIFRGQRHRVSQCCSTLLMAIIFKVGVLILVLFWGWEIISWLQVQGSAHLLRFNHSIPCLDKSKSKKNAQNDKVFPFFLRSILFPSRTAGKRHEQMPQQNPKTPFFSTSFANSTFQTLSIKHKIAPKYNRKLVLKLRFLPFPSFFCSKTWKKEDFYFSKHRIFLNFGVRIDGHPRKNTTAFELAPSRRHLCLPYTIP